MRPSFEARRRRRAPQDDGRIFCSMPASSSPSLPRRDDLDLVAGLERRLRPPAFRQHVVIHRDRKMRALIVEFAEQRIELRGADLARFAVDDYAHGITSLSMVPRSIYRSVSSASAGASKKPWR